MFSRSFLTIRVTPEGVSGRVVHVSNDDDVPASRTRSRDASSSWACQIVYVDTKGVQSERQITCRRLDGYGGVTHVHALCHSREMERMFKIENIRELIDLSTGEVVDPVSQFQMLATAGALPFEDKAFTAFTQICSFMAKCDGSYHPLEAEALEAALTAYCIRFNGDDGMIERAMRRLPSIAPDGKDVSLAIKRLKGAPMGNKVARLVLDHCSQIIDADGSHHPKEIEWAVELGSALKGLATR